MVLHLPIHIMVSLKIGYPNISVPAVGCEYAAFAMVGKVLLP
jgi:hypothetical protein